MKACSQSQFSVLIVDDSLALRARLRSLLEEEPGLSLAGEAETGAHAVDLFFRCRPDVVLLGVCLPDRSGFKVMQCIKQAAPRCVVILLSDASDPCVDEVSRMLGATEVCHKGGELTRIRELLRGLVSAPPAVPACR
jgi:DNA-binding NarL/FixJ family response regulator